MMAGSTIWLEREAGALIVRWLGGLTDWTPFGGTDLPALCLTCARYGGSLELSDVPHALLHEIAAPIDELVSDCFATIAAERYEHLLERGWRIYIHDGVVDVRAPAHTGLEDDIAPGPDLTGIRLQLTELHTYLLGRAIYTVQQNQHNIAAAVRATVEPVLRRMAAELIEEVCGP